MSDKPYNVSPVLISPFLVSANAIRWCTFATCSFGLSCSLATASASLQSLTASSNLLSFVSAMDLLLKMLRSVGSRARAESYERRAAAKSREEH